MKWMINKGEILTARMNLVEDEWFLAINGCERTDGIGSRLSHPTMHTVRNVLADFAVFD